jgi:GGDEF domain-containing protein
LILLRRRAGNPDQYYWLTALLTTREAHTKVRLLIAAVIGGLGLAPLVVIAENSGPHSLRNSFLAVSVTLCCLAMASLWLRRSWPTRVESQGCVALGAVCIAAACLIEANPVIALLGASAFAVLTAYCAFFHTVRLMTFVWAVGAVTLTVLAVRISASSLALAVAGPVFVALVSVFCAFVARMTIRLTAGDRRHDEFDELTGLLNADAFYDGVSTLIGARERHGDQYLMVAIITIDGYPTLNSSDRDQVRVAAGQQLRKCLRGAALLAHVGEAEYLIAELFTKADPSAFINRIQGRLGEPPARLMASIGAANVALRPLASHPPHEVLDEILGFATDAMHEAQQAGGNQVRLVLNPTLSIADEPDSWWPADDLSA